MKQANLKVAILLPSLAVLITGIIVLVAVAGTLSFSATQDLTDQLINARVNEYSNEFEAFSQDVYGALITVTPLIDNYLDDSYARDTDDPRGEVISILTDVLLTNDKITALWTCWEPNAFDGNDSAYAGQSFYDSTGRFIPFVYKIGERVRVEALTDYDDAVAGDYYLGALNSGKPYATDPYFYTMGAQEKMIYSIAVPILSNGKAVGVVGADIQLQNAIALMNSGNILGDGYLFTVSPGGLFTTHQDEDLLMKHYNTTWMGDYSGELEAVMQHGGSFSIQAYSDVTHTNMIFLGSGVAIGDTGRYWAVCGTVPLSTVNASSASLLWTIIGIGVLLILLVAATIYWIIRNQLRELPLLTATAEAIAEGNIKAAALDPGSGHTKNEITLLIRAFSKMVEEIDKQAEVLSLIAGGDYSATVSIRSGQDVINQAIHHMLESTNDTLSQISSAAEQVSAGSGQIANGAQVLAHGAAEQATAIEQLGSSVEAVAAKSTKNAEMANDAAVLSGQIRQRTEKGSAQMDNMMLAVNEIKSASNAIQKVMKSIDEIAFQTNILSLNAAVEAARAGQHGKGFAVVADEVRSLAAKSAEAARETGKLIENSIEKANMGYDIACETSASLKEIVASIEESVEIIGNIAQASREQTFAIDQINLGIDQVTQVVQQNTITAEEAAASSEEMSGQALLLREHIARFQLKKDVTDLNAPEPHKPALEVLESVPYALTRHGEEIAKY